MIAFLGAAALLALGLAAATVALWVSLAPGVIHTADVAPTAAPAMIEER